VLYTGTGANLAVTGVGFQPDFVWIKSRNNTYNNNVFDAVRGVERYLLTDSTLAENGGTTGVGSLTAFDSDGFSLGTQAYINNNTTTFVAWNWKANGAGVSNTDGTITSTVSVNTTSGFSIVTYTGTGASATVGHGLGVAPAMVIVKSRTTSESWPVYHTSLTNPATYKLTLSDTSAEATVSNYWNGGTTSTVFGIRSFGETGASGVNYVAYCFAPVAGYSAFGSYTGNGNADGPMVYTGFRPRWVMYKNASSAGTVWIIFDTARNTYNFVDAQLRPNATDAENSAGASFSFDLLSNGFKVRSSDSNLNGSGNTMIYACFAENPFSIALAR
jgi:hypothetical protein